jgi:cytoskeletal protein CcmA (bactofilin family)
VEERQKDWLRRPLPSRAGEAPGPPSAPPEAAGSARTFIDHGAAFDGTLRLREGLRIDAEFRGAIESEGTVVVGEAAGLVADIRAREVVICGAVVGNVVATRQLTIRAGGRLHGDVETPCLEIEKHAFFNGRTRMARPEAALRAAAEAEAPPRPPARGAESARAPQGASASAAGRDEYQRSSSSTLAFGPSLKIQ